MIQSVYRKEDINKLVSILACTFGFNLCLLMSSVKCKQCSGVVFRNEIAISVDIFVEQIFPFACVLCFILSVRSFGANAQKDSNSS